jgi:hypothetical protein
MANEPEVLAPIKNIPIWLHSRIKRFEKACDQLAWKDAQHPSLHEAIDFEYKAAKRDLVNGIARYKEEK